MAHSAYSAARYFNCNPFVSASLAGVLLHSSFTALNTGDPVLLFGFIPVTMVSYSGSVVPILLIVWVQSYVERFANKISPKPVKIFLAPMLTIIVTGILGITVAGPLGNIVGQVLAVGFNWLNDYAGWVIPVLMGAFCPFFVMTGMHYCFAPIQTIQYATLGYGTPFWDLACWLPTSRRAPPPWWLVCAPKTASCVSLAFSSGFTALMGITEPALYGVTLKLKPAPESPPASAAAWLVSMLALPICIPILPPLPACWPCLSTLAAMALAMSSTLSSRLLFLSL